jgi:hypothetical protein
MKPNMQSMAAAQNTTMSERCDVVIRMMEIAKEPYATGGLAAHPITPVKKTKIMMQKKIPKLMAAKMLLSWPRKALAS